MPALIIVSTILTFCFIIAGQFTNWLHCLINLVVVVCVVFSNSMMELVVFLDIHMAHFDVERGSVDFCMIYLQLVLVL